MAAVNLDNILSVIVEGANGNHVYSNERALVGYMPAHEFLRVFEIANLKRPTIIDLIAAGAQNFVSSNLGPAGDQWRAEATNSYATNNVPSRLDMIKLAILNAVPLITGVPALSVERATLIGLLRARWIKLGCLFEHLAERCVTYDEVVVVQNNDPVVAAADIAALVAMANAQIIAILAHLQTAAGIAAIAWVTTNAELIWCISEHLMRSRGHHFKEEYTQMIRKMYASSSNDNVEWPNNIEMVDVLRTAIHPFGIRVLPMMAIKFAWHGKVGNGMISRMNGASNGYAAATTAYAGLAMIGSEPWFPIYMKNYENQITLVTTFAKFMLDRRYQFHESAGLYGVPPLRSITIGTVTYTMSDVELAVTTLAPVLQGFIIWSKENDRNLTTATFAFANAKVLEKRASSNPMMAMRMKALLQNAIKVIEDSETSKGAIMETFPLIEAGEEE